VTEHPYGGSPPPACEVSRDLGRDLWVVECSVFAATHEARERPERCPYCRAPFATPLGVAPRNREAQLRETRG
jgi:hypothetical protein